MKEIEKVSNYRFFYNESLPVLDKNNSIQLTNSSIDNAMQKLLAGTDVTYEKNDNIVVLVDKGTVAQRPEAAQQNKATVRGRVLDEAGTPIIGANVIEEGVAGSGTVTDYDGNFTLVVSPKAKIRITYLGYGDIVLNTAESTSFNVVMQEDTHTLGEVVVTALGIKREEKALGYAVQKVGGEQLSVVKGVNVASSLTGKVAGLSINNSTEISETPSLQLRGEDPLVVVDGVAFGNMSLNDISAEDIESIDVLKGATASALYGVRGRSGAVMITTKKSGEDGTLKINLSNNTMFSAGYLKIPKAQSSYSTGNYGQLEYYSGYVWGDYMDGHEVMQYNPFSMQVEKMPLLSKGKNNISNFFRPSLVTNTNINISQSGKLGGFRVSATQIHNQDQYPNSKLDKYILTGGGDIKYNKFKLDANFTFNKEMSPNMPRVNYGNGNIFYNMLIWGGTEYDIRDFKNYWKVKDQKQNWPFEAWYDNPYYIMNERLNKADKNLFTTQFTLSYDILKNLSVILRSGYDTYTNTNDKQQPVGDSGQKLGYYEFDQYSGSSWNNDLLANGNFTWNDFGLDMVVGTSSYWYNNTSLQAWTRGGLSVPAFYSLNASVERPGINKSVEEKVLYSIYSKVGLSWKNGIYIDLTGRNDWSSTLPSSSRSYFYPSVSSSFIPTAFYNPFQGVLDFWKIRASWTVAKKDLNVYETNSVYNVSTDVWNGLSTATYPTTLRDPNVKPETETSYELGTNLRFFNDRLNFDFTYFNRLRYDRLIQANISMASGSQRITTNTQEELRQKGMEFQLKGKPIVSKEFQWEALLNVSFWHWYYEKLDPIYSSQDPRLTEGERYDKFFIYDWERDGNNNIVHQAGLPVKNKYETVMGYSDPKMILGFSSRFVYKNWDLNISFDGRIGGLLYSWTEQALWHAGSHPDSDNKWRYDEVVNKLQNYVAPGVKVTGGSASFDAYGNVIEDTRKFSPNDVPVSYQSYTMVYNENPWDHNARQNIKDASFIKLREVALNYTLPSLSKDCSLKNVRIGVVAQNLFMWTKEFRFSDPDRGRENLNSPTSRYIGLNINLTL
ncbi:MAG: SusC/RagA family TonB-linked outer membrane protein [Petrimonas sp.]|uniref:SusC/RagA family TonB-linked outer membrane protein n=1 Tax=Petrimonas sp. TaxID=2023866 RepID=UPI002B396D0A|nr:SusC/RagA family TonB-linked outer membrane protein [Petrimonas sp.]MEA5045060.1 SusC/RagA family TonB-linked outer membrane protein [Petrimonas sp.]